MARARRGERPRATTRADPAKQELHPVDPVFPLQAEDEALEPMQGVAVGRFE
jgi:hypothetical protein